MIKCCILEDNKLDADKIIECINSIEYLKSKIEIHYFSSPNQINLLVDNFDILLLDIDLPHKSGIDFANDYIKIYSDSKIIFISTHDELVFNTFKVHPYSFIKKENIDIELSDVFTDLFDLIAENKKIITINNNGNITTIQLKEIIYIESYKHYCYIYQKNKSEYIKHRININNLIKELPHYFYKINRSYIINLNEIMKIKNGKVTLNNDLDFSIQRGKITEFQNVYNDFLCRRIL